VPPRPAPPATPDFPLASLPALKLGARLSEQLAEALAVSLREGRVPPGQRLPTEAALVAQFGVSRTVVREALSRLKTLGLIETRQGSGAYVKAQPSPPPQTPLVLAPDGSVEAVLHMVEVRRALEAEAAALAAARITPGTLAPIHAALQALDTAVAAGGDGVPEDMAFHTAIAQAAGNPFLLATLAYLSQLLIGTMRVTRANEATRADMEDAVRDEHRALLAAIEAGDVVAARFAGSQHMVNAAQRIGRADPAFWAARGRELAERLQAELGAGPAPSTSA
jgi:GntR family transcriptional repressor for pyruvate dehydrogenase complex